MHMPVGVPEPLSLPLRHLRIFWVVGMWDSTTSRETIWTKFLRLPKQSVGRYSPTEKGDTLPAGNSRLTEISSAQSTYLQTSGQDGSRQTA
jgi:hypothetical protein